MLSFFIKSLIALFLWGLIYDCILRPNEIDLLRNFSIALGLSLGITTTKYESIEC